MARLELQRSPWLIGSSTLILVPSIAGGAVKEAQVAVETREGEEKKMVGVSNKLRVRASAEIKQQSTSGRFAVFVDRPPASKAEAMRDIKGHFRKIAETASKVLMLLEVFPYEKKGALSLH